MKRVILLVVFFISALGFSQEKETTFEKEGDLVKATYYFDNGNVKVQGFFKDKKLTGTWSSFDKHGNKTKIAHYKEGKKVGKWFVWEKESLKEINYDNNVIVSVNDWESKSRLALNNK
ncbi:MAG: nicotinic acid mononucleotide adenyltransferase [Polaribacter sp.]